MSKYYVYIDYQKDNINDLILYDLQEEIVYGYFEEFGEFYSRQTISYDEDPELYESYLRDYDENKAFSVSKEKFSALKLIDPDELRNVRDFIKEYSLEEWII